MGRVGKRHVVRLAMQIAALLAFAGAMFAPAIARAAMLPACEVHELSLMPIEWLGGHTAEACSTGTEADPEDPGDVRVPAMCDARGASVVAPPRILSVGDARIDAATGQLLEATIHAIGPSPHDSPISHFSMGMIEQATIDAIDSIKPAPSELLPPYLPLKGGPRAGVSRGIDHPPRH